MRGATMETHDLHVSILHAGTFQIYVSHAVEKPVSMNSNIGLTILSDSSGNP
jgi:hypothetical protein